MLTPNPTRGQPTLVHLQSPDGTKLAGTLTQVCSARGNALIVHGYAEHHGRYEEVAQLLNDLGMNTLAIDLRGHGLSEGPRGLISRFDEYVDDALTGLDRLLVETGELPVLLVGHSNGGLVTLRLLADPFRLPQSVKAAILSSPYLGIKLKLPRTKHLLAHVASRLLPRLTLPHELAGTQLTHDPDKIHEHNLDPLCHDVASARWFTEASAAQEWVREYAHRIAVPTQWLVAGTDQIADTEATRQIRELLKTDSEYFEFPDMYHEVFNELDRQTVFEHMKLFVERNFSL